MIKKLQTQLLGTYPNWNALKYSYQNKGVPIDLPNENGESVLSIAVSKLGPRHINEILRLGGNPDFFNKKKKGESPLNLARKKGNKQIIDLLEKASFSRMKGRRGSPNLPCKVRKEKFACRGEKERFVSTYVKKDYRRIAFLCSRNFVDLNWAYEKGESFLIKSVKNNDLNMVKSLFEKCLMDPFSKDDGHRSAFDHARWDYDQKRARPDKTIFNYLIEFIKK